MGNLCKDSMYDQIKEKNPGQFQKYLEMTEISKAIDDKTKAVQQQVQSASSSIKADNLNVVDAKHKEIKDHF